MPTTGEIDAARLRYALLQLTNVLIGNNQISIARKNERGHADLLEPIHQVELLYQPKPVSHDALVGLPALPRYKVKERPGLLPFTEKQIKELIDKGTVRRQRISGENDAGDALEQTRLKTAARSLHREGANAV